MGWREDYLESHLNPNDVYAVREDGALGFYFPEHLKKASNLSGVLILERFSKHQFDRSGFKLGEKVPLEEVEKKTKKLAEGDEYRRSLDKIITRMRRAGENVDLVSATYSRNPQLALNIWRYPYDFLHYFNEYLLATGWREPIILLQTGRNNIPISELRQKWSRAYANRNMVFKTGFVAFSQNEYSVPKIRDPSNATSVSENILSQQYRLADFKSKMEIGSLLKELSELREFLAEIQSIE